MIRLLWFNSKWQEPNGTGRRRNPRISDSFWLCTILLLVIAGNNQGSEISSDSSGGKAGIETLGNVTVLAGQTGQLKCKVTNPGNYTVSWLRHRDTHLLASGVDAYTADGRFRAFHGPGNTWGLRISNTKSSDNGVYECQISTTPPIPAFTFLFVVEPVTRIEGLNEKRSELFIKAGSTINLTCVVEDATENAPKHILWRHNSRMINFEWARGGMSLVTEKKTKGVTVSRLLIQKAVRTDSGIYNCEPQNAHPASVKIHVLEQGEKQAAMQGRGTLVRPVLAVLPPLVLLLLTFVQQLALDSSIPWIWTPSNQLLKFPPSAAHAPLKSNPSAINKNKRSVVAMEAQAEEPLWEQPSLD